MNFNSLDFLILFLPASFLAFYCVPMQLRLPLLVVASLIFYGVSGITVLVSFIIAILWTYFAVFLFGRAPKAVALLVAISGPAFFLVMFKYLNFILTTVQVGPEFRGQFWFFFSILLPAGISFYTFELISYAIDIADKKIAPDRNLVRFSAFATFFPHLIAGPIMRYADLRDQLRALQEKPVLTPKLMSGLKLLAIGLFFKVFVADLCGLAATRAKNLPVDQLSAIDQIGEMCFWSMQIYYDFWAYSVMAIGLGRLFCVELPVNFREPYKSENPREFWRRWHITLSYWLRDYVYIRMGGHDDYVRNILFVFALVGLWHGAGWNFVAWGVYHGLLVILYHLTAPLWDRLPRGIAVALTFALVTLGWPLFFLPLDEYARLLSHFASAPWGETIYAKREWLYLCLIGLVTFGTREQRWLYSEPTGRILSLDSPVAAAALMFAGLLFISLSQTFIYFRF